MTTGLDIPKNRNEGNSTVPITSNNSVLQELGLK
jgi:hypothetical protein